jgi:hypothetical protein
MSGADVLDKVQEFCTSNNLEAEFESFAKDHVDVFLSCLGN